MVNIQQKNQALLEGNSPGSMRYDMFRNLSINNHERILFQAFFYFSQDDGELYQFGRHNPPQNRIYERGNFVIEESDNYSKILKVAVISQVPHYISGTPSLESLTALSELPEAINALAKVNLPQEKFPETMKALAKLNLRGTISLYNSIHAA